MSNANMQVLVHLDSTSGCVRRLRAAREFAARHEARLAALYAVSPALIEMPYAADMTGAMAQNLMEIDRDRRVAARAAYDREVSGTAGPIPAYLETEDVPIIGAFVQQALFADMVVLGQHDPAQGRETSLPPDFVQSVLIGSGRPALVLPYAGEYKAVAETVVIAWKETRESARAVAAALPMLKAARRVHVIAWEGKGEAPEVRGERLGLDTYLGVHGVSPTWHRQGGETEAVGELMLSQSFDLDADLLVMGCYGHSRAREFVLGGASRTVLNSMTLPVLMSH